MPLTDAEKKECLELLKKSTLLKYCTEETLKPLVEACEKREFKKGEVLLTQGGPSHRMYVLVEGDILRERLINNQIHQIDTAKCGTTVGSLHLIRADPVYATAIANSEKVVTYSLQTEDLRKAVAADPKLAEEIIYSLTREIRNYTKAERTPLLVQHPKKTPYLAVSVAASIESFYRSALNSLLNNQLLNHKGPVGFSTLFPNMQFQLPTRVVYINGFKGIRQIIDEKIRLEEVSTSVRLAAVVTPGIIMTPVSSFLEACNAVKSPEPLQRRWLRGYIPRTAREVIFGIGLNQLSDWCEERVPLENHPLLKNALGSMSAGVISGYISHVPHNLATLKMLNPSKTYSELFKEYSNRSLQRVPSFVPQQYHGTASRVISCLFPTGVTIRTSQIVGSYIILNGIINFLQKD